MGAAYRLKELGHSDFALYEKSDRFGGLAASYRDSRGFTWDFAIHVLHSHYRYFDQLMEDVFADGFNIHPRRSWVREHGRFIPYPFQNNLRYLPGDVLWDCVRGLLEPNPPPDSAPATFDEWILAAFGEGMANQFLRPYNRKLWCTDPREMSAKWVGERVPAVDLKRILEDIFLQRDDTGWGPNAMFQFPREGGTGEIWRAMGNLLPENNVFLGREVTGIDAEKRRVHLSDGGVDHFDRLISAAPLPALADLLGIEALRGLTGRLLHTQVQVVCVAVPRPIPPELSQKSWIYCPEDDCCFYRVTPFSNFSRAHTPDPDNWCSFMCEVSTPQGRKMQEPEELAVRVAADLGRSGIIDPGSEKLHTVVGSSRFGYPIPCLERDRLLGQIQPMLESLGIYSRGRFGGWKYEAANMDHCVMQGVECVNRLLLGDVEITYHHPEIVNSGKL